MLADWCPRPSVKRAFPELLNVGLASLSKHNVKIRTRPSCTAQHVLNGNVGDADLPVFCSRGYC